jgi:hypothetical protein
MTPPGYVAEPASCPVPWAACRATKILNPAMANNDAYTSCEGLNDRALAGQSPNKEPLQRADCRIEPCLDQGEALRARAPAAGSH